MILRTPAICALLCAVTLPVLAEGDGYAPCMDAAVSTLDMISCAGAETRLQDARLNSGYKAAMQSLPADQQTRLRDGQRLWIQYRDANCGLYARLTGGSVDRINSASCVLEMTRARAEELERLVQQP